MRPRTLRGQLALVATVVTALWVIVMTVAVDLLLVHQLDNQAGDVLRARVEAAATEVTVSPGGRLTITERPNDQVLDAGIWFYEGSTALESPARGGRLTPAVEELIGRGAVFRDVSGSRLYARPVLASDGRQVGTVVAAVNLRPYTDGARLAVGGSIALAFLLLGSVYPVTRVAIGRALRPVADLSDQAARWSADDVSQRFGSKARPRELEDLAQDLDGLLDRLAAVLRHERQLSAEISHELRTPLTRMTAEIELLQRGRELNGGDGEPSEGLASVLSGATQMEQILETLLATARSESSAPPGRCRLNDAVRSAVAQTEVPHAIQVTVHDAEPAAMAGVDAAVLQRIIAPLLQNAVRHALSTVELVSSLGPEAVQVVVRDDGPGLGVLGEQAFEPGVTGAPEHGGAGLGLPLARRLARASGGDLNLLPVDSGAAFAVRLPRA